VQLKTLTEENAEQVARHLAMVRLLIEQDPELALEHAKSAASRAGRIAFIRETLGVTAYTAGDYGLALRELLAHRRATASQDQLPLIVDSERGLGRPKRALEEGRAVDRNALEPSVRVNLAIAMSGARLDLEQNELALAELEIRELDPSKVFEYTIPILLLEKGAPSAHSIGADGRHRMRESERQGGGELHARYLRFCLAEFCFVKTTATL
jgi:hypothetical protein